MANILETLKGLLQKGNALLGKLPFKGLAEKYIPAGAKAKVPFLETIVTPYANQIVAGLAALLLVSAIGGGGGSGSSLNGSTWEGERGISGARLDLSGFGVSGSVPLPSQETYVFDSNTVRINRVEFNNQGNRVNPSSKTGTYTVDGNTISMVFDDGIFDGTIEGSTLRLGSAVYNGNINFKPGKSRSQTGGRVAHPAPPGPANPESDFTVQASSDGGGVLIIKYTGSATNVVIPNTIQGRPVTEIGGDIFSDFYSRNNNHVTSVYIPASVTKIAAYAFRYARLTEFPSSWPRSVTKIEQGTFSSTRMSGDLVIPEGITSIGQYAFNTSCENLTSITLPSTIREIQSSAFSGAGGGVPPNLTTINIPKSVNSIIFVTDAILGYGSTKLDLTSQARLREVGYTGRF